MGSISKFAALWWLILYGFDVNFLITYILFNSGGKESFFELKFVYPYLVNYVR